MGEVPPVYSRISLPAGYCQAAPTYTEIAQCSERVLHSAPASPVTSRVSRQCPYVYKTDHLEINLGRSPWGMHHAAYGRGGIVEGTVKFIRNCSHVVRVTVKLQGHVTTRASEHPLVAVPQVTKLCLLSKVITVYFAPGKAETIPACKTFPFSISFPETVLGQDSVPLPPTFTTFHPSAISDVEYALQVDVVRKGLHRHEMCAVPVLYFPKSRPALPSVPASLFDDPYLQLHERVKRIAIEPAWPRCTDPTSIPIEEVPLVDLLIPAPACFASGNTIPVALTIRCPFSPILPQALAPNIGLFLVKRKKLWLHGGRQITVREQLIYKAETFRMTEIEEGVRHLTFELRAGEAGCEHSFKVNDAMQVEHFIRVIIRPPAYLKHIPVFQHDEPVELTTDQYGTLEHELLAMDGIPTPALGLATPALRCSASR